ncbi:MAG TPA: hypothetical protein VGR62_23685 [Candidatus Binatia bacterium]|nr:hypothetical protein [Candidatus Binatia bacterium]
MQESLHGTQGVAELLREAESLGRVRAVLRSCSGFVEVFCSTEAFEVGPDWLTVRLPGAHLHVQVPALTGAALHEAGDAAHPERPSMWFYGRCGSPCLLLILDQTDGDERQRQEAAFQALRSRHGAHVRFAKAADDARVLH